MKTYTLEEVSAHNQESDCWIVIEGMVLDVTAYLPKHPGGGHHIFQYAGQDCTGDFEGVNHSKMAWEMLKEF